MTKKLLSQFSLKWNPFLKNAPIEGLLISPQIEGFCRLVEQTMAQFDGFAMVSGISGLGKSVVLRILRERLEGLRDAVVRQIERPSSSVADFYREMGDVFAVPLRPHNRWCGVKNLRAQWEAHIDGTLLRPILLIDEAQERRHALEADPPDRRGAGHASGGAQ